MSGTRLSRATTTGTSGGTTGEFGGLHHANLGSVSVQGWPKAVPLRHGGSLQAHSSSSRSFDISFDGGGTKEALGLGEQPERFYDVLPSGLVPDGQAQRVQLVHRCGRCFVSFDHS